MGKVLKGGSKLNAFGVVADAGLMGSLRFRIGRSMAGL